MDKSYKSRISKIIFAGITVLVLILLMAIFSPKKITQGVEFMISPETASLSIEGSDSVTEINNGSIIKLRPGNYHITLKSEGFADYESNITVRKGGTTMVATALEPLSDEYAAKQDQTILEGIAGYNAYQKGKEVEKNNSFINELPIVKAYYRIDSCELDGELHVNICVDMTSDTKSVRDRAYKDLEDIGVSRDYKKIIFKVNDYEPIEKRDFKQ